MACPSFGSTSGVALYWTVDADPSASIATLLPGEAITWNEVPITGESLTSNQSSTISERITSTRAYADSTPSTGEVSGGFSYEFESGTFMNTMLKAVLQAGGTWADQTSITNGSTPACFAFLKTVQRPGGTDYYVYRGVQVDTLSATISPGALIAGDVGLVGVRPGAAARGAASGNEVLTTKPASWTLVPKTTSRVMSSGWALQNFHIMDSSGTPLALTVQEISFSFSNAMRQQTAVGLGDVYSAGVASDRFEAKISASVYYANSALVDSFLANEELKIAFDLADSADQGWHFLFDKCKPLSAPDPQASASGQDLMQSVEFQAFQSASDGTVSIRLGFPDGHFG